MHGALWEAVRAGLVFRLDGGYTFLHDRVQEAAYASIPEQARAARHLRIGRRLAADLPDAQREEAIFEIATQFNRGAALIDSLDGARAGRHSQSDGRQTCQSRDGLRLGPQLLRRRRGAAGRGGLDAALPAHVRAGVPPGRVRVPDRRPRRRGRPALDAVAPRRDARRSRGTSPAYAWCSTPRWIAPIAPSTLVSTTCGTPASTGRRTRRSRPCERNTRGSGSSSGTVRSRRSSTCR